MNRSLAQLLAAPTAAVCLLLLPASIVRADSHNEFNPTEALEEGLGALIGGSATSIAICVALNGLKDKIKKLSYDTEKLGYSLDKTIVDLGKTIEELHKITLKIDDKVDRKELKDFFSSFQLKPLGDT